LKLHSIVDSETVFDDGAKTTMVSVIFNHETGPIKKNFQFTQYTKREDECKRVFVTAFLKAAREAERDIAFRMFGDKWREHVGQMWGPVTDSERKLVEQAASLRPDLLPEDFACNPT